MDQSVLVLAKVIKFVMSSAAEAELAALFMNAKLAVPIRQALIEMGFPQPAIRVKTDNSTAYGIINDTIKQNRSKAMDMRILVEMPQSSRAIRHLLEKRSN